MECVEHALEPRSDGLQPSLPGPRRGGLPKTRGFMVQIHHIPLLTAYTMENTTVNQHIFAMVPITPGLGMLIGWDHPILIMSEQTFIDRWDLPHLLF